MRELSPNPAERSLIESLRARSSHGRSSGVRLGIGDDCAILQPPAGHEILVTTDFSLENIHFRRGWQPPESVGHRCLARGLSDLAAMGARPLAAFLSLALPRELVQSRKGQTSWRDRFLVGFLALANKYHVPLAGGDTAQSPEFPIERTTARTGPTATGLALADIALVGSAPRGRALLRSGAEPGDRIYVTGQLGGAAAELTQLAAAPRRFRDCTANRAAAGDPPVNLHPHLYPEPRIGIGAWRLKNCRATAAIDLSDGLSTDLDHLCEASSLAAMIDASRIPIHPLAIAVARRNPKDALELALHGGDDYELLFTAAPAMRIPRRIAGVPVTCIGEMRGCKPRAARVQIAEIENGTRRERPLPPGGWEHYRDTPHSL